MLAIGKTQIKGMTEKYKYILLISTHYSERAARVTDAKESGRHVDSKEIKERPKERPTGQCKVS
jgi:hypothetical protein